MRRFVFILLTIMILWAAARPVLAQGTPCDTADQLRQGGLIDEAEQLYVTLLEANPDEPCALAGIQAVAALRGQAAEYYAEGSALEAAGDTEAAIASYLEAVAIIPRYAEAHAAIARLVRGSSPTTDPFVVVRKLADQGLYTAAKAQLVEIIKENPGLDVPADLAFLGEDEILFWAGGQNFYRRNIAPITTFLGKVVKVIISLAVGFFVLVAVVFRVFPWIESLFVRKIDIQPFNKGPKDLEVGPGLAALVEEKIKPEIKAYRLDMVEGYLPYFAIPDDVRKVVPTLWLLDLLEWAFPPKVLQVKGNLLIKGSKGAGVTVSLVNQRDNRILDVASFWDYDQQPWAAALTNDPDPEPYYRLTDCVVDWLVSQLAAD